MDFEAFFDFFSDCYEDFCSEFLTDFDRLECAELFFFDLARFDSFFDVDGDLLEELGSDEEDEHEDDESADGFSSSFLFSFLAVPFWFSIVSSIIGSILLKGCIAIAIVCLLYLFLLN